MEKISEYLEINTKFIYSSNIEKDNTLKAQVIDICKNLNAKKYINAIGGQEIFKQNDIELNFLKTEYKQFKNDFVPYLSIIDILMFNSKNEIKNMLNRYERNRWIF